MKQPSPAKSSTTEHSQQRPTGPTAAEVEAAWKQEKAESPECPDVTDAEKTAFEAARDSTKQLLAGALAYLVKDGYTELGTSRRLDLNDASSRQAVSRAMASLDTFVDRWIDEESNTGGRSLSLQSFNKTQSSVCPVFPFD